MLESTEIDDGDVVWRFDGDFLMSRWACVWERGDCQGILDHPAPELRQGCCSVGARIEDDDEARLVAANVALLDASGFQNHALAASGVFEPDGTNTRVVDGACIFFNRPGFAGGEGCALHLAAIAHGESPIDWKPSVCWRLPLAIDWDQDPFGRSVATVRRWGRRDWGGGGRTMAWCCTEEPATFLASTPLVDRMADELTEIVGAEVVVELRGRLGLGLLVDGHGDTGGADVDATTADQAPEDEVGP